MRKSLAEFAARRSRIKSNPFFAAASPKGTSAGRVRHEKYFARRECARMGLKGHSDARFGANDFCSKRALLFWNRIKAGGDFLCWDMCI